MDYISSKNISLLIKDTLALIDNRLVIHGSKVAYLLYRMLELKGGLEKYEIAELVLLATVHDIGAYRTDMDNDMLLFEFRDYAAHSIYGYMFLKYLSPFDDRAKILLYHHSDWTQIEHSNYEFKNIAAYVNIAEKAVIYNNTLGGKFVYTVFEKYRGNKFSPESLDLFYQAVKSHDAFNKLNSEAYNDELNELYSYLLFTNEEKTKFMEMLMYCIGFRSENSVVDTVTGVCICEELGIRLGFNREEMEILYYGALLHDLGMLAIPRDIIDASRKLTPAEIKIIRSHVELEQEILQERLSKEVLDIVITHHERCDGSGYPRGLKDAEMNRLQKVLQVADTVCGLTNKRSYREPKNKETVIQILREETDKNKYSKEVVDIFIAHYDDIMTRVTERSNEILFTHNKLNDQYKMALDSFNKQ